MQSLAEGHQQYLDKQFDLKDKVEQYLERIETEKNLNAYLQLFSEEALREAKELDARRNRGENPGLLAGILIAVKDNIACRNQPLTCGSRILKNYISPFNAAVIERINAAGGIVLGKTNMDEFAMGSATENSAFGPTRNPLNAGWVPGGSSGGSAVAVAAGLCDAALGSETGGSVRQPAAFCGIAGLKPGYGRVSRYGLVAYSSSLDQIGPLANSAADLAYLLEVIAGPDEKDATSAPQPVPEYRQLLAGDIRGLRVALPAEYLGAGCHPDIRQAVLEAAGKMREHGARLSNISLPLTDYAVAAYYLIASAEASSNLARYDGVHFGLRQDADELEMLYRKSRRSGFGREVKRRILLGTYALSAGYYDKYYRKAQQVRRLIRDEYRRVFQKFDIILTPTTPVPPFPAGNKSGSPLEIYKSDIFTVAANLAGICALSLPAGRTPDKPPVGLQLMADSFREEQLLQVGHYLEKNILHASL